jgi:HemY protein
MPVSPVTGRLDAFQWKDPIANKDAGEAVIEHDRGLRAPASSSMPAASPPAADVKTFEAKPIESAPPATLVVTPAARGLARTAPAAAPVVPLIHVPDDPGPDSQAQLEAHTEASPPSSADGWRKLRGLFK